MVSLSFLQYLLACICVEQLRGLTLIPEQTQNPGTINLYSVSTSQFMETSYLYGSTQGGTSLYLKAIGFDSIITNNIIFIGKYSCIIDETYVKEQELSCKTTASLLNDNSLQNLLVTVGTSDNKNSVCTSQINKCLFSYIQEKSPYLHYLIPSIGFANSIFTSKGEWIMTGEENNEIEKILIGEKQCVKNQYRLLNTQIYKDEDVISCQLAEDMISSTYQINVGTRRGNILSQKSFKMLPIISSLKWALETNDSFILFINGYGFKSGLNENIVKVSGTDVSITVLEVSTNQLKVQIHIILNQFKLYQKQQIKQYQTHQMKVNQFSFLELGYFILNMIQEDQQINILIVMFSEMTLFQILWTQKPEQFKMVFIHNLIILMKLNLNMDNILEVFLKQPNLENINFYWLLMTMLHFTFKQPKHSNQFILCLQLLHHLNLLNIEIIGENNYGINQNLLIQFHKKLIQRKTNTILLKSFMLILQEEDLQLYL